MIRLDEALRVLSVDQLEFLHRLIGLEGEPSSPDPLGPIEERIHALYQAPVRQKLREGADVAWQKIRETVGEPDAVAGRVHAPKPPSFSALLQASSKQLGVDRDGISHAQQLTYVSHELILRALVKMTPEQREQCFERAGSLEEVAVQDGPEGPGMGGSLGTLAGLGLAQASGFGIYQAATTALGFATHAVGITLPFAAYTGLASTIAFVIGPAGFLAAATWAGVRATGPKWERLHPAVLAMGSAMAERQPALLEQPLP